MNQDPVAMYDQVNLSGYLPDGETDDKKSNDPMKSADNLADFRKISDWWIQARTAQAPGRYEQALDEDFYDGLQWSEEDQLVVESRGQAALVFNQIKPVIDWVSGTERRAKVDFHVFPRTADDRQPAETKTKLLKYIDDTSHADFKRSLAFKDSAVVGIGWLEDGVLKDPTKEPIYSRYESWRNMWPDNLAKEPDLSDGRYMFRTRWCDVDIAKAMFPAYGHAIESTSRVNDLFGGNDDDEAYITQLYYRTDYQGRPLPRRSYIEDASYATNQRRMRVKLVECWYRKPMPRKIMRFHDMDHPQQGQLDGQVFEPNNADHAGVVAEGYASVYDAIKLEMWCCIFVEGTMLQNTVSPYRHDDFPFTPIVAFRRKRDGAFYGFVRNMRDPQEDLNKRRSKALHILSSKQVIAEEGAVEDIDEAREEVAAPDGWITVRKNKKFEIVESQADVSAHMELEKMDVEYVRQTGGVTTENLGHQTNASSGKAIEARQTEGDVVTTEIFDNKHFALQRQGEKRLSLIEQFMPAPKQIRIVADRGAQEFLKLNQVVGIGLDGQPIVENDITATKADFVIDLVDYRRTIRQAMYDQLVEMIQGLQQMGPQGAQAAFELMDLIVDMNDDLPGKDALVARIRKLNGQVDPSTEGTPEQQQADAAKAAEQQKQAALQERAVEAKIADTEASAALKRQQAMSTSATMLQAVIASGEQILVTPQIAAIVDELVQFVNQTTAGPAPLEAGAPQPIQPGMMLPGGAPPQLTPMAA